jgi:hypothetical protein
MAEVREEGCVMESAVRTRWIGRVLIGTERRGKYKNYSTQMSAKGDENVQPGGADSDTGMEKYFAQRMRSRFIHLSLSTQIF